MSRLLAPNGGLRILPLLAMPGCLVSFNDYPVAERNDITMANAGKASGGNASAGSPSAGNASAGNASAGNASSGGSSAGAGGTSFMPGVVRENVVDDFEDGNQQILEHQGRSGTWYVANDGEGTQTPGFGDPLVPSLLDTPRVGSSRGAHTYGGPFLGWGALIGTPLATAGDSTVPYDLRRYDGIKLWVRSGSTSTGSGSTASSVRVILAATNTSFGGSCTVCNDHFGADVPLTSKWEQVDVPFSQLKQIGYGEPQLSQPDLEHVTDLLLLLAPDVSFDLWVDDIELY